MTEIVQLTAADIDTTVNHEPRIEDLKLAEALGFERDRNIRALIEKHLQTLEGFGEVCCVRSKPTAKGGRPGRTFYLNRKQALFITAKSDTERAAHVTVQMVEVFDAVTRGREVEVRAHKRHVSPLRQSVAGLRAEIEELRKAVSEMKALASAPAVAALPHPEGRMPGPFEPGSDLLKDLTLAIHSTRERMKRPGIHNFGDTLIGVLADLRAMRDGRSTSGRPIYDWVNRRTWSEPVRQAVN